MRRFRLSPETLATSAALATALVAVLVAWAGAELAAAAASAARPPANPFALLDDLASGRFDWSEADTVGAVVATALVLGAGAALLVVWWRRAPRHHVDRRARLLAQDPRAMGRYVDWRAGPAADLAGPGPEIGVSVVGRRSVRATWECVGVYVAGARMRKTTNWVIPHVLGAPGPAYTTSNKRDVVDLTRGLRAGRGETWVYDPQSIAGAEPTWWWNPLDLADDVAGALMLAGIFAAATRPVGSTMDSYFDPEGEALLAMLLLAAHRGRRSMTDVYRWLTDPREDEPVAALHQARHELAAAGVRGVIDQPDRQRAGVYGTAKKMVGWCVDERLMRWCVDDGTARRRFSAEDFATSSDTVYALSREGPGSAGPLTAAFTAGVARAAERVAATSPGGRLPVPMMAVLDEVANVCRWRELPDLYSHYGSRGIVVESFLQSWSQGVECWGQEGMKKLWSAANIGVYAGGAKEEQFLEGLSRVCGEVDVVTEGTSDGRYGLTRSQSFRKERVLDVGTLAALPVGRAVVLLSGAPPVVVRVRSVWEGEHVDAIRSAVDPAVIPAGVR